MNFEALYTTCFHKLYRFALNLSRSENEAEEIVQETFLRAMTYAHKLPEDNLDAWLFRVARNVHISRLRKRQKEVGDAPLDMVPSGVDVETKLADQDQALQQLIDLGVDRVLTSAGGTSAPAQAEKLAHFIAAYGHRITILPGGGIRPGNVKDLLTQTGAKQVHSSCGGFLEDPTVEGNAVSYAYRSDIAPQLYETVDADQVKALREVLDT